MKWFDNIKIRNKLLVVFGILLLITICISILSVVGIRNMEKNLNKLNDSFQIQQEHISDSIGDFDRIRLANSAKWFLTEDSLKDAINVIVTDSDKKTSGFKQSLYAYREFLLADDRISVKDRDEQIAITNDLEKKFDEYVLLSQDLNKAVDDQDQAEIIKVLEVMIPVGNDISDKVLALREKVFISQQYETSQILDKTYQTTSIVTILAAISIILVLIVFLFAIRSINRPISDLEKKVTEVAHGDLSNPIGSNRKDELGHLANSIGDMITEISMGNKLMTIMDNLDSMVSVCDMDYNLLFANKSMAEKYGFDREAAIGTKCYKAIRHKDEPCSYCNLYRHKPIKETFPSQEYENVWDDYLNTWISGRDSIIRWVDGTTVSFQYKRDTAMMKKQEEQLREALDSAKTASATKSAFLANMSHEIRTPLNAIIGNTDIQLQKSGLDPEIRDALDQIYSSGDLLHNIINDILDLSKIEAGKLELAPAEYELASLISDTVTLNLMRKDKRSIEFKLKIDENLPSTLVGDDLRIKQIINNLLSNALKYTRKGEVELTVNKDKDSVETDTEVTIVFRIKDTGQGMTAEQIDELFEDYSRFNNEANRTTEGTGLGMSITHNLIEMMHGDIEVESELGSGSTFTVKITQGKVDSGILGEDLARNLEKLRLSDIKHARKAQIVYEKMPYGKVLIVDDVESNLKVAKGLMGPYKMVIDTAVSGFEAIDKVEEGKKYDVIFMDCMMPQIDGIEATKKIREAGYKNPIVALTANALSGQAEHLLSVGFDDVISKPIDMRQLNEVLKKNVRDKQPPEVLEKYKKVANKIIPEKKDDVNHVDPELAESFIFDANKSLKMLNELINKKEEYTDEEMKSYVISVHGMKSALANIGEKALSSVAAELERSGRNNDVSMVRSETPDFITDLKKVIDKLTPITENDHAEESYDIDVDSLHEKISQIKKACETYDKMSIKIAISELKGEKFPHEIREKITAMSNQLLSGSFDEVSETADTINELI